MRSPLCEAVARNMNRDHGQIVSVRHGCAHASPSYEWYRFAPRCKLGEEDSAVSETVRFHTYTHATVRHVRQRSVDQRRAAAFVRDFTMSSGPTSGAA